MNLLQTFMLKISTLLSVVIMSTACGLINDSNEPIPEEPARLEVSLHRTEIINPEPDNYIAVGARQDLFVTLDERSVSKTFTLVSVTSNNDDVLGVVEFSDRIIVLEAIGEGTTEILIVAQISTGEEVHKSVELNARTPAMLTLNHSRGSTPRAYYLVDSNISIDYVMHSRDQKRLIGYDYYPFDIEPEGALLHRKIRSNTRFDFQTSTTPGKVVLRSNIDDTTLDFELIEETDITDVRVILLAETEDRSTVAFILKPAIGDSVILSDVKMEVENVTPDICEVKNSGDAGDYVVVISIFEHVSEGEVCDVLAGYPSVRESISIEGNVIKMRYLEFSPLSPISVGTTHNLEVDLPPSHVADNQPPILLNVESDNEDVLKVLEFYDNVIVVEAVGRGSANISVAASAKSFVWFADSSQRTEFRDSVELRVH